MDLLSRSKVLCKEQHEGCARSPASGSRRNAGLPSNECLRLDEKVDLLDEKVVRLDERAVLLDEKEK
jgi:hypothetical protein